jgi:glycerol-3-phosphate responsive antiterminator
MSDNNEDTLFWNLVDSFIEQANNACEEVDPGVVSAALLNAAARFNAFVVAASSIDRKEYIEEIESARNYLTGRYRELVGENLEDYRDNYKVYVRADEEAE